MAGLEALSMEIPLIASDNRGTREYMVHKENGFVCDSRRVETVVEGIEYMMAMDSAQREKMKKVCRQSVRPFEKKCTMKLCNLYIRWWLIPLSDKRSASEF